MGEEEIQNQPIEQSSEESLEEEHSPVKILRSKLEEEIRKRKALEKKLQEAEEVMKIANIDEIREKLAKIDRIEFENLLIKKYPFLADEVDKIWEIRREGETIDDVVAKYIGKKHLEEKSSEKAGFSLGSKEITPNLQEVPITKLPPEEQEKKAREIFEQLYGS